MIPARRDTRVTSGLGVLFDQYTLRSIFRVWRLHLFRPDGPSEGRAAWLGGRGVMVIGMVSSFVGSRKCW